MPIRTSTARAAVAAAAIAGALAGALVVAPDAAAAHLTTLGYDTTGSTTLTNPNSEVTVTFAPTILTATLDLNQNPSPVSAALPLAPVRAGFKAYGFLPASGTVVFTQVRPIKATLFGFTDTSGPSLTGTAQYVVTLRDVVIGGKKADVGTNCQTINPVTVAVTTAKNFNLVRGTVNGTYDLGGFQNCGAASFIVNDTLPGTGNTLTLKIRVHNDPQSDALQHSALAPQAVTIS